MRRNNDLLLIPLSFLPPCLRGDNIFSGICELYYNINNCSNLPQKNIKKAKKLQSAFDILKLNTVGMGLAHYIVNN